MVKDLQGPDLQKSHKHHHSKDGESLHEQQEAHAKRLWDKPNMLTSRAFTLGLSLADQRFLNELTELTGLQPGEIFIRGLKLYGTAVKAAMKCISKNDLAEYKEEQKRNETAEIDD